MVCESGITSVALPPRDDQRAMPPKARSPFAVNGGNEVACAALSTSPLPFVLPCQRVKDTVVAWPPLSISFHQERGKKEIPPARKENFENLHKADLLSSA